MPQMAPMWWYMLFMTFILMYYMYMVLIYFYKNFDENKSKKYVSLPLTNMKWKW